MHFETIMYLVNPFFFQKTQTLGQHNHAGCVPLSADLCNANQNHQNL